MKTKKDSLILTEKEICHYFYFLGAADGVINSLKGTMPDFEKRFKEFKNKNKKQ
jgi:hypothetical protein